MKIVRFLHKSQPRYGIIENDVVYLAEGDVNTNLERGEKAGFINGLRLLAPCEPTKIICSAVNYKEAFRAMKIDFFKEPSIFLKPATALLNPLEKIILPPSSTQVDLEAELVIVVKSKAKDVHEEDAGKYILGYTCGNDVTARDLQKKDGWPGRAKCFDTFAPLGPVIATNLETSNLTIKSRINGETVQNSSTADMLFSPSEIFSFTSSIMTLLPGDVIFTGSPYGWSPIKAGDALEIEIENIGVLKNFVG